METRLQSSPDLGSSLLGTPVGDLVLRVVYSNGDQRLVRTGAAKCSIGADPQCTVQLDQPGVQPVHCLVLRGTRQTIVRGWTKQTRLNGCRFTDAPLENKDRLSVGSAQLEVVSVHAVDDPVAPPPARSAGADLRAELREAELELARRVHELAEQNQQVKIEWQSLRQQQERLYEQQQAWQQQRESQKAQLDQQMAQLQGDRDRLSVEFASLQRQQETWRAEQTDRSDRSDRSDSVSEMVPAWKAACEDDDEGGASITEYMNNLLQRTTQSSRASRPRIEPEDPETAPPEILPAAAVSEPEEPGEYRPRSVAPERIDDMAAMRELANRSARSAVNWNHRRRWGRTALRKTFVSLGLILCAVLLAIFSNGPLGLVRLTAHGLGLSAAILAIQVVWICRRIVVNKRQMRAHSDA